MRAWEVCGSSILVHVSGGVENVGLGFMMW